MTIAYDGSVDAQGNYWFHGQTGSGSGGASINRMTPDVIFTQWPIGFRQAAPTLVGTVGRVYLGGDGYWDNRILAVSTGAGPALKPPGILGPFGGQGANCLPAGRYRTPSSVTRYWIDARSGKRLGTCDSLWLGIDMDARTISCAEQATLPWLSAPMTSEPVTVTEP